jgi:hypothetical protein
MGEKSHTLTRYRKYSCDYPDEKLDDPEEKWEDAGDKWGELDGESCEEV